MSALEEIVARLEGVRPDANGGFMAKCPCHADKAPSLHLWQDEQGHVAFNCFAGCDHAAVRDALGLASDKRDDDDWTPRGPAIASYRYVDAQGGHLYTVCRTADKQFPCWRPDPAAKTGRAWNLNGTARVLYRLPAVVRAVAAGEDVWICEGEKDCDALHRAGVVATCNPGGAGKWREEYSAWLKDAAVIVVRDKDEPGRKHAASVVAALGGIASSMLIVEAAQGKDASDHLAAGLGIADFVPVLGTIGETADESPFVDWSTFWDEEEETDPWLYPNVLARGRGHSLYAPKKQGKSLFALFVAAKLATGSEPVAVVYLDYEMTRDDIRERLRDMAYGPETDLARLFYDFLPALPPLDTREGGEALMELIDGVQDTLPDHHVALIIDSVDRAVRGKESDADTWRDFYAYTGIELKRRGNTWARTDHAGKDETRGARGSSGKGDDPDVIWQFVSNDHGITLRRDGARMPWVPDKVSFGLFEKPLHYTPVAAIWPKGTAETAAELDRLGVPRSVSVKAAREALSAAKSRAPRSNAVITAAVKWRKVDPEAAPETLPVTLFNETQERTSGTDSNGA